MIKFVAQLEQGNLYGFGFTDTNLNRLEFNDEPIFFCFDYAGHPELFGLILYMGEFQNPIDLQQNMDALIPLRNFFVNPTKGITTDTLLVFPIVRSVMQKFREKPFWALETHTMVTTPGDKQMFFCGTDDQTMTAYFREAGFITSQTRQTKKGFG